MKLESLEEKAVKQAEKLDEKADLKRAISIVLSSEVPSSKMAKTLKEMGYENTNEMAMVLSMTQKQLREMSKQHPDFQYYSTCKGRA